MTDTTKKSFLADFAIKDRESCERAIRNGRVAALVSGGLTAVFAAIGLFYQPTDAVQATVLFDPWMFVDVGLILLLAFFIFRKSRVAATILVGYFVATKLWQWSAFGEPKGWLLALVFVAYYVTAMRGTYAWHSTYRHSPVQRVDREAAEGMS